MSYTILIADDDHDLLRAVSIRLKSAGYEVVTALDSYQAVQFANEHRPDLVILDINMPAGDGFTVQERLRNIGELATTPVIYLTGDTSELTKELARRTGAYALLHKPFDDPPRLAREAASEEEGLEVYRRVRDEIRDFVAELPASLEREE